MGSRTLVGIVAYGGLPFLELGLAALREQSGFDVFVIVAKPGDAEMWDRLTEMEEVMASHYPVNTGFPACVNDLYDKAFVHGDYDNLIIMGNDVIPMPGAIEAMVRCADTTDYEMVCGSEFNARFLYDNYPEARPHFEGPNLIAKPSAFTSRVWELHKDFREGVEPDTRKDIRNMTLFKRSSFEKVGYADASFWPNGYYEDLDYCLRCDRLGVSACGLKEAAFFHWWSRTIHQGEQRDHGKYYRQNEHHYREKWGGLWQAETYALPYHGDPYQLAPGIILPGELKITSRDLEPAIIEHWSKP